MVFVISQCDDCTFKDVLVVEVPVNGKYFAAQFVYTLGLILAECLGRGDGEVEV